MIQINLLPPTMQWQHTQREAAKTVSELGNKILMAGAGGTVGLMILAYLALVLLPTWVTQAKLKHWKGQWGMLEKQFNEVNAYAIQEKRFYARFGELAKKKKQTVRWAKLLNVISDVVPPSIQLVRISSGPLVEMVAMPAPQADPANPAAAPSGQGQVAGQKIRQTFHVLELEGIAEKGLLGEEDLNTLLEQMRINDVFSDYFERVDLVGVVTQPNSSKRFSLRCRFKENVTW